MQRKPIHDNDGPEGTQNWSLNNKGGPGLSARSPGGRHTVFQYHVKRSPLQDNLNLTCLGGRHLYPLVAVAKAWHSMPGSKGVTRWRQSLQRGLGHRALCQAVPAHSLRELCLSTPVSRNESQPHTVEVSCTVTGSHLCLCVVFQKPERS